MLAYKITIGSNEQCLQNSTLSNILSIPLIWMPAFFKVVVDYMVISNIPTSFFQFSPINIL